MSHLLIRLSYAAVALFVLIQLVPVRGINGNAFPDSVTADTINWDSLETQRLAQAACFDCHSYQTELPWYGRVAPVSWVIARHVREGREDFNFSTWQAGSNTLAHDGTSSAAFDTVAFDTADYEENEADERESSERAEDDAGEHEDGEHEDGEQNALYEREDILEEVREVIYENEMPPRYYTLMHPSARLTNAEKDRLAQGLVASLSQ
jgi:hypothetical protein